MQSIRFVRLFTAEVEFLHNWEGNHRLHASLTNVSLPMIKYHQIPLKSGFDAIVRLQLPPNLDTSGKTKYPMLIDVYAGPGSYGKYFVCVCVEIGTFCMSN